jgi:hypothetical protein
MSETVMVNLSVLGKLQLGEKLRVRHGPFFQLYHRQDGRFRFSVPETLLRWWEGSSRHSDFRAVLDVYNVGMREIAQLRREKGDVARATETQLLQRMKESMRGLRVLERTYAEDITLVSRIQRLRERICLCCGIDKSEDDDKPASESATSLSTTPSKQATSAASMAFVAPELALSDATAATASFQLDAAAPCFHGIATP